MRRRIKGHDEPQEDSAVLASAMPDLIITGIPRSGTSLAAAIIDRGRDALCLSEPGHHGELMRAARNSTDFVTRLGQEFSAVRRTILAGGAVLDRRNADGSAVTNYFADSEPGRPREPAGDWRAVSRPGLSRDFTLGIKHNALYAAALPEIVQRRLFRVVAIIRDPVAVLTSWRSLNLPVSAGRLPAAERFWPEMAALTWSEMDLVEKQIRMIDLFCCRFAEWATASIVSYEMFVAAPERLLVAAGVPLSPLCPSVRQALPNRGRNIATQNLTARIRQLATAGALPGISRYYPQYYLSSQEPGAIQG
jgi:hypothetical protein